MSFQQLFEDVANLSTDTHNKTVTRVMWNITICFSFSSCADPEGWGEWGPDTPPPPPPKNHKNIVFLSNTGPDPLKYHKATRASIHRHSSETPFKRRFAGVPMVALF